VRRSPLLTDAHHRRSAQYLGSVAKPLGGGLLVLAGAYVIASELIGGNREAAKDTELSMKRLVLIGVALSIDNLVVGCALGAHRVNIVIAAVIIAIISVALSLLGLEIGRRLGDRLGQQAELVGGAVLILVGVAIGTGHLQTIAEFETARACAWLAGRPRA
jgi:putative Mn2+ efflux pump MntP